MRVNGRSKSTPKAPTYIEWRERRDADAASPSTREDAIDRARRKAVELRAIRDGLIAAPEPEPRVAPKTTIGDAIDDYLTLCARCSGSLAPI